MEDSSQLIRPLPTRNPDRDWNLFKEFWEATREGKLIVQRCKETKKKVWPPRFLSPYSPGGELEWVPIEGKGEIYTYNVVYKGFLPFFEEKTPFAIVVVDLGEGVRMIGNATNIDPEKLYIGMEMEVDFEKVTNKTTLVNWKPIERG